MISPLPAIPVEASPWDQALYAFLVEKGNRSGSRRTVESYKYEQLAVTVSRCELADLCLLDLPAQSVRGAFGLRVRRARSPRLRRDPRLPQVRDWLAHAATAALW